MLGEKFKLMSQVPANDLFQLVHSLTKDEKRSFRLRSKLYAPEKGTDGKNYLLLFDALQDMEAYDEEALKKSHRNARWVKNLKEEKRNLMERIEAFLQEYHAESHPEGQIGALIQQAEILRQRKLFARCRKKLDKARGLAEDFEDFSKLKQVNEIERKLVKEFWGKDPDQEVERLIKEWSIYHELQMQEQELVFLYDRLSLLIRMYYDPRDQQAMTEVAMLRESPLLHRLPVKVSFLAQRMFRMCWGIIHHFEMSPAHECATYEALIEEWKTRPLFIQYFPKLYRLCLTNLLHAAIKLDKIEMIPTVLDELDQLKPATPEELGENFQARALYQMVGYFRAGDLQRAVAYIPEIEAGMKRHATKINPARKASIQMNVIMALFFTGQDRKALDCIEAFLKENKSDHRQDLVPLARLLECLVFFDREENEVFLAKLHALAEWLRANGRWLDFERTVVLTLRQAAGALPHEKSRLLAELHRSLAGHMKDGLTLPAGMNEVMVWAFAKITGVPPAELLRSKDYERSLFS